MKILSLHLPTAKSAVDGNRVKRAPLCFDKTERENFICLRPFMDHYRKVLHGERENMSLGVILATEKYILVLTLYGFFFQS